MDRIKVTRFVLQEAIKLYDDNYPEAAIIDLSRESLRMSTDPTRITIMDAKRKPLAQVVV